MVAIGVGVKKQYLFRHFNTNDSVTFANLDSYFPGSLTKENGLLKGSNFVNKYIEQSHAGSVHAYLQKWDIAWPKNNKSE